MDVIFHGLSTSFQAAFAGPIVAEILVRTLLQVRIHRAGLPRRKEAAAPCPSQAGRFSTCRRDGTIGPG